MIFNESFLYGELKPTKEKGLINLLKYYNGYNVQVKKSVLISTFIMHFLP